MRDKLIQVGVNTYKRLSRHVVLPVMQCKVETTKACNLRCVGCRRNFAETLAKMPGPRHLTVGALWRICATTNMQMVRFEGDGEPLCNPHFRDLVAWCHERGIRSAMTCNGTLLNAEYIRWLEAHGMRRIHISFDGATAETFEKQRPPAKYDHVLENCERIGKGRIQLFMNCVPSTQQIIEELEQYVLLAKQVGATGILLIKFQADVGFGEPVDWHQYKGWLEDVKKLAKEKGLIFIGTGETNPTFHECEDAYVCPYITLDDNVYACAYMANMRTTEIYQGEVIPTPSCNYIMGDLNNNWMRDIWRNGAYHELRGRLKASACPSGAWLYKHMLLENKKRDIGKSRFSYCNSCLCRWGETGL